MKSHTDQIVIELSRSKIFQLLLLTFICLGLSLISWNIAKSQSRFDPLFIQAASIGMMIFGLLGVVFGFSKLFDRKPGLVVDQLGIYDNASALGSQFIKWEDVVDLSIYQQRRVKYILLFVADPKEYMSKAPLLKRIMMFLNERECGTPLFISSGWLQCEFKELEKIISTRYQDVKASG
jgi:hypothetical protein